MKKLLLILPGYCVGLGGLVLITYRTLRAIGSPSKTITLQVNMFGEQYLDLVSLVFLWIVCLFGLLILMLLLNEKKHIPGSTNDWSFIGFHGNAKEPHTSVEETYPAAWGREQLVFEEDSRLPQGSVVSLEEKGVGGVFSVSYWFSEHELSEK